MCVCVPGRTVTHALHPCLRTSLLSAHVSPHRLLPCPLLHTQKPSSKLSVPLPVNLPSKKKVGVVCKPGRCGQVVSGSGVCVLFPTFLACHDRPQAVHKLLAPCFNTHRSTPGMTPTRSWCPQQADPAGRPSRPGRQQGRTASRCRPPPPQPLPHTNRMDQLQGLEWGQEEQQAPQQQHTPP